MENKNISIEDAITDKEVLQEEIQEEIQEIDTTGRGLNLNFLMAETGEGSIDLYLEHPININQSKGLAQVLRGATGLFGSLNLAIIDILIGLMNYSKEKKVMSNVD